MVSRRRISPFLSPFFSLQFPSKDSVGSLSCTQRRPQELHPEKHQLRISAHVDVGAEVGGFRAPKGDLPMRVEHEEGTWSQPDPFLRPRPSPTARIWPASQDNQIRWSVCMVFWYF